VKLVIIIPAFNESPAIQTVLRSLPKNIKGFTNILPLVVDDGSTDETYQKAQKSEAQVIRHSINRGVGAATKTGILWALKKNADITVTFDADGQHDPNDIKKIIEPILLKKADVVIGSRFLKKQKVPIDRLIINWCANLVTYLFFGVFSTDTQSGLRALSKKAMASLNFKTDRMEFSSELLLEAKKNKLRIKEIPTSVIYTTYSRKKGQKNLNAIPVMARLLVKLFR